MASVSTPRERDVQRKTGGAHGVSTRADSDPSQRRQLAIGQVHNRDLTTRLHLIQGMLERESDLEG